jgi:hypothetical protein
MDRFPSNPIGYPDLLPLFELIEWTFHITLTPEHRTDIERQVAAGWNNGDSSEQHFVNALLRHRDGILHAPPEMREARRSYLERDLRSLMAMPRPGDCGRVLHVINSVLQAIERTDQALREALHDSIARLRVEDPPPAPVPTTVTSNERVNAFVKQQEQQFLQRMQAFRNQLLR